MTSWRCLLALLPLFQRRTRILILLQASPISQKMEGIQCRGLLFLFLSSCLLVLCCFSAGAAGYENYTVGDSLGWYDNLKESKINYQKWVSGKNFSLGDFLSGLLKGFPTPTWQAHHVLRDDIPEQQAKEFLPVKMTISKIPGPPISGGLPMYDRTWTHWNNLPTKHILCKDLELLIICSPDLCMTLYLHNERTKYKNIGTCDIEHDLGVTPNCIQLNLINVIVPNAVFNTDKNHSVIQTYNITTYRQCDYDDADEDDTISWSAGEPTFSAQPVTVAVPLLKEGMTYFFSGNYDGEQCKHGQHFKINVTHGEGLPNSLKNPTPASPGPSSQADDDSTPDTVIPSNFNNPVNGGADAKETSGSVSLARFVRLKGGVLRLLGTAVGVCLGVL